MKVDPKKIKTLAVDDDAVARELLQTILESHGYQVLTATGGKEALGILQAVPVDLVMSDLVMPGMDGLAFLKALRAKSEYRFTPVVMLTTESRTDRKQQAKSSGAQAWATKPCPPSQLVDIVNRLAV